MSINFVMNTFNGEVQDERTTEGQSCFVVSKENFIVIRRLEVFFK